MEKIEPRPKQGMIVTNKRVRMVGTPFAPRGNQSRAEAREHIDAAEAKRRRRAQKRMEQANGQ